MRSTGDGTRVWPSSKVTVIHGVPDILEMTTHSAEFVP